MTANTDIARLMFTLDAVKPPVVRRIEVPPGIRLDRLHTTLQVMIGWSNSHLWEFRAGASGWGVPDHDGGFSDEPHDTKIVTLISVLEDIRVKSLEYLYDFGDSWEHTIKIERIVDAEPGVLYQLLIDASGQCLPEDNGGPWATWSSSKRLLTPSTSATPS